MMYFIKFTNKYLVIAFYLPGTDLGIWPRTKILLLMDFIVWWDTGNKWVFDVFIGNCSERPF